MQKKKILPVIYELQSCMHTAHFSEFCTWCTHNYKHHCICSAVAKNARPLEQRSFDWWLHHMIVIISSKWSAITCLPEPIKPVDRFSHRLSVTPVSSHFHLDGSLGIFRPYCPMPFSSCTRLAASLLSFLSSSQAAVSSNKLAPSCACTPFFVITLLFTWIYHALSNVFHKSMLSYYSILSSYINNLIWHQSVRANQRD